MRIALIKKINEKTPYWIKAPFAQLIRRKLIGNSVFSETYRQLSEYDKLSQKEKDNLQFIELKRILRHAYENTAYYREMFDKIGFDPWEMEDIEELKKIPIITKKELKKYFEKLLADNISNTYSVTTGGTTGEPTKIEMDKNAIYKEWAFVYHYWSKFGYDYQNSRLATFRGVNLGEKIYEINPLYQEVRMNPFKLNENNIDQYIKKINRFQADFIYGYPSAVYNFCRIAAKKKINVRGRFKAALLISENLFPFQEDMIKTVLGCEIAIFYGHTERAVFAERYKDGYVFNQLYGVTEINEKGEPIVTGFINKKMPLINYLVDDEVKNISEDKFMVKGHRDSDVLYGLDGEQVSMAAINFHDRTFEGTSGYQFVQNERGKCIIRVIADKKLEKEELAKIAARINEKLGIGFVCTVEQTDHFETTARGKYKMLIQNIVNIERDNAI